MPYATPIALRRMIYTHGLGMRSLTSERSNAIRAPEPETGEVVYDNQIADATQAIGGSIVIHSK
jgi:hypothetical protein